jgi:hypothetical protein
LEVCLQDAQWHGANARLVIADHWARYAIVPWSDALSSEAERLEHARVCMSNAYGDVVAQWTVTISEAPPGAAQVACAIPTALLQRLHALLASKSLRVKSVQPQLIAAFNGWRGSLSSAGGWFVTVDEGSLAAAHFSQHHWDYVRSVRIGNDWEVELKRLQTFGRLARANGDTSRVYVDAPLWLCDKARGQGHAVEWLIDDCSADDAPGRLPLLQRLYA